MSRARLNGTLHPGTSRDQLHGSNPVPRCFPWLPPPIHAGGACEASSPGKPTNAVGASILRIGNGVQPQKNAPPPRQPTRSPHSSFNLPSFEKLTIDDADLVSLSSPAPEIARGRPPKLSDMPDQPQSESRPFCTRFVPLWQFAATVRFFSRHMSAFLPSVLIRSSVSMPCLPNFFLRRRASVRG